MHGIGNPIILMDILLKLGKKLKNDFGVHASNCHDGIGQVISKLKLENPVS